jgi:exodeoxyribonuclease VII large subunit
MQTRTTTRTTIAINRLGRISLARIVADRQKAKDQASARLTNALTTHTRERSRKLRSTVGMLDAVSPLAVLSRGYAIVKSPDGATYYRDASRLSPGDKVKILLAKGSFDATVDGPNNARQRRLF